MSRQLLVNVRKLMTEREKLTDTLRNLAGDLDELQHEIDECKSERETVDGAITEKQTNGEDKASGASHGDNIEETKDTNQPKREPHMVNGTNSTPQNAEQSRIVPNPTDCTDVTEESSAASDEEQDEGASNGLVAHLSAFLSKTQQSTSNLLLLGAPAVTYISTATNCPLKATKKGDNYDITIDSNGTHDVDIIWDEIKGIQLVIDMDKMLKDDRKYRNTVNSCFASLKKMVGSKEQTYRKKYPEVSHRSSFEVLGYRFAQLFSPGKILQESLLYQSEFKYLSKTVDCISVVVLMKVRGIMILIEDLLDWGCW